MSRPPTRISQFRWTSTKGTRDKASRGPAVLHICFCSFYLTIPPSRASPDMTTVFHKRLYGRFTEIQIYLRKKRLHWINQGSSIFGSSFSNRDNVKASIQFRREREPQHLKGWSFLKNRAIHLHINSMSVIRPVKQDQHWNQQATSYPSLVSCRSDSSSEANSSCWHRSTSWSHLK